MASPTSKPPSKPVQALMTSFFGVLTETGWQTFRLLFYYYRHIHAVCQGFFVTHHFKTKFSLKQRRSIPGAISFFLFFTILIQSAQSQQRHAYRAGIRYHPEEYLLHIPIHRLYIQNLFCLLSEVSALRCCGNSCMS